MTSRPFRSGFTIVELLVVIVVIGILAAIIVVGYNGITQRARETSAQAAAKQAHTKVSSYAVTDNNESYPEDLDDAGVSSTDSTTYEYSVDNESSPKTFCITATVGTTSYYVSNANSTPASGLCSGHTGGGEIAIADGDFMQIITEDNCPTERTRAVDARDNHTYWVQKLADGKCWMLTNLGYAGGGTDTYGDVKSLTNGTGGSTTYTTPSHYVVPSTTNYTTEPTDPSTSTNGTGQYGYLYNWCGAMGGQETAACDSAGTPTPDSSISVCPAGWHVPTSNGGEFTALNTAINSGSTTSDAGLRTNWLAQRGGFWNGAFSQQGSTGRYWSSTHFPNAAAYSLTHSNSSANPSNSYNKNLAFAVRCLATS